MRSELSHDWTFLTNHSHVLVCLLKQPDLTVREISDWVGITERAVLRLLSELEAAGIVTRTREGRRNRYAIQLDAPLRHPLEGSHTVGELLLHVAS